MSEVDIFRIRENFKMSQLEFGELIGVDRRTIINYEQGKKIPASKIKLLELLLKNGPITKKESVSHKNDNSVNADVDSLHREILDLKDHIKTLKDFLDEKNKLADMYKRENSFLMEKVTMLEDKLKG
jgi:DNA-binding XRE family transcriptional regulator